MTDIKGQSDRWFAVGDNASKSKDVRLDSMGLALADDFLSAVDALEEEGSLGFQAFGENIFRHNYFRNFEEFSERLGLKEDYQRIFSQLQPVLELVSRLTQGPTPNAFTASHVKQVTEAYRKFLGELKGLFNKFKTDHAEV